jgi:hypothetical protein
MTSDPSTENNKYPTLVPCVTLCGLIQIKSKDGSSVPEVLAISLEKILSNNLIATIIYPLSVEHISSSWKATRKYSQKNWSLYGQRPIIVTDVEM